MADVDDNEIEEGEIVEDGEIVEEEESPHSNQRGYYGGATYDRNEYDSERRSKYRRREPYHDTRHRYHEEEGRDYRGSSQYKRRHHSPEGRHSKRPRDPSVEHVLKEELPEPEEPLTKASRPASIEHRELEAGLRCALEPSEEDIHSMLKSRRRFECLRSIRDRSGRPLGVKNIVEGLSLHSGVLTAVEEKQLLAQIQAWAEAGRAGRLRGPTYCEPPSWRGGRAKGRITIQFGSCYKYDGSDDLKGSLPPSATDEVEGMPEVLEALVERLVRWKLLPRERWPDSAVISMYSADDCMLPCVDHDDYERPVCTLSLLSEASMVFSAVGTRGQEDGMTVALPAGSLAVLDGNSSKLAQNEITPVPERWVSITLRQLAEGANERLHRTRRTSPYSEDPLLSLKRMGASSASSTNPPSPSATTVLTSSSLPPEQTPQDQKQSAGVSATDGKHGSKSSKSSKSSNRVSKGALEEHDRKRQVELRALLLEEELEEEGLSPKEIQKRVAEFRQKEMAGL
ncbi:hypothetical protein CYMTET_15462 [Cymbomonas tetramitiformis]|uniref:CWF21 domain-containing protein n=1 Tax=Cymbomonas tetramitiformis TaxID=36881 RepID=A0AAE0GEA4_9CHLO|nr:hypothetical protein CYMTET_15462 [Cymbomonas tetramitiformis]